MENRQDDIVEIPMEWYIPDDLQCQYATSLVVQHSEHEFILSFFQAPPPLLLGSPEEIKRQAEQMDSIRARCVGRIIVAASRMPEFLRVLQLNVDKYRARLGAKEEED